MEDLKELSVFELAMKLNNIIKIKSNHHASSLDLITMDYMWNAIVMELWERIPSLKNDSYIKPVFTDIRKTLDADNEDRKPYSLVRKIEQDK